MNNSFLEKQKEKAYDTYKYFVVKMIFNILKICFVLAIVLFLSFVFNNNIIDIIALIYTFISIYMIYHNTEYYTYLLNDIKNTLDVGDFSYVFTFNRKDDSLMKGLNYGK